MEKNDLCPICKIKSEINCNDVICQIECIECGKYQTTFEAYHLLSDYANEISNNLGNIIGYIRENSGICLRTEDIPKLLTINSPSLNEKADKILRYFLKITDHLGDEITIQNINSMIIEKKDRRSLRSVAWAKNKLEMKSLLKYLEDLKMIEKIPKKDDPHFYYKITPTGINTMTEKNINSNKVFCAMSFDVQLRPFYDSVIFKAVEAAGYEAIRVDDEPNNGGVVDKIITLIKQSRFLIADLTDHKAGVYFEAGFAKGLGLEVIFTCEKTYFDTNPVHFDVRHLNFLLWEKDKDLENIEKLKNRIISTIGMGKRFF